MKNNNTTFQSFKQEMKDLLIFNEEFDDNFFNDLYVEYKSMLNMNFESIEEWTNFFFIDFTLDKHELQLKTKI